MRRVPKPASGLRKQRRYTLHFLISIPESYGGLQSFITFMDALKLRLRAKDQLHPILQELMTGYARFKGSKDWEGRSKMVSWHVPFTMSLLALIGFQAYNSSIDRTTISQPPTGHSSALHHSCIARRAARGCSTQGPTRAAVFCSMNILYLP